MKCEICGSEVAEGSAFCGHCGNRIISPDTPERISAVDYCPECGEQVESNTPYCPKCGAAIKAQGPTIGTSYRSMPVPETIQEPETYTFAAQDTPVFKMKWYKFLIWFLLFFNAVVNLASAYLYFTGKVYDLRGVSSRHLYNMFPGAAAADKIYAAVLLALAVCFILARMKMAQFRKDAPRFYLTLIVVSSAAALIYSFAISLILSGYSSMSFADLAEIIGRVIGTALMFILNHVYFTKRKSLFIH